VVAGGDVGFALSCGNHLTTLFLIPPCLYLIAATDAGVFVRRRVLYLSILMVILAVAPYSYLFWRTRIQRHFTWKTGDRFRIPLGHDQRARFHDAMFPSPCSRSLRRGCAAGRSAVPGAAVHPAPGWTGNPPPAGPHADPVPLVFFAITRWVLNYNIVDAAVLLLAGHCLRVRGVLACTLGDVRLTTARSWYGLLLVPGSRFWFALAAGG